MQASIPAQVATNLLYAQAEMIAALIGQQPTGDAGSDERSEAADSMADFAEQVMAAYGPDKQVVCANSDCCKHPANTKVGDGPVHNVGCDNEVLYAPRSEIVDVLHKLLAAGHRVPAWLQQPLLA